MSPECLPPSFSLIPLTVREQMWFQDFSSWPPWRPSWIMERNKFSNSKSPCHPNASHQVWLQSHLRCSHLGYRKGNILANLNLYVAPMPPSKFQLNLINSLGGDVVCRYSRWLTWQPSRMQEGNDFSNSKSPCGPNASHQV